MISRFAMNIKKIIIKLLPKPIYRYYTKARELRKHDKRLPAFFKRESIFYERDMIRFFYHSRSVKKTETAEKLISTIIETAHVIEKGLTLDSNIRLGFGQNILKELIDLCDLYIRQYDEENPILLDALSVILEYDNLHRESAYELSENLQQNIDRLRVYIDSEDVGQQPSFTKEEFFAHSDSSFDIFSSSRHSLRDFSEYGDVDIKSVEQAIALAQNSPSSCNRQSARTYVVINKEIMNDVLLLQNGNRGFGQRANKLIVVTSDLQDWKGGRERLGPYLDAGIYIMNLLYSLHFYKIGACALNWFVTNDKDENLRKIIGIPDNEVINIIIACGVPKDKFKIARAKRKDYLSLMRVVR